MELKSLIKASAIALTFATVPSVGFSAGAPIPAAPEPAVEQPSNEGWYLGAFGGFGFMSDIDGTDFFGLVGYTGNIEFDTGWQAGGHIGYKTGPMRFEGEFVYHSHSFDSAMTPAGVAIPATDADVEVYAGMFNVYYDMDDAFNNMFNSNGMVNDFSIVPYIGLGIGYAHIDANGTLGAGTGSSSSSEFAYQGIAGLLFPINEQFCFFTDYRYFATTSSNAIQDRFQSHTVNFGINVRFDAPDLYA